MRWVLCCTAHLVVQESLVSLGLVLLCVLQVGIIGPDKKFKVLSSAEVQDYLQEVE